MRLSGHICILLLNRRNTKSGVMISFQLLFEPVQWQATLSRRADCSALWVHRMQNFAVQCLYFWHLISS